MKVELSRVQKLKLAHLHYLDPVTVFLEDFEPGRGKIVIDCCGESWTGYWGSMSGRDVASFFCTCDKDYLANSLSSISADLPDYSALSSIARKQVLERRRERDLSADEARALFDECSSISGEEAIFNPGPFVEILGSEWWRDVPTQPNPAYLYMCRIITAVQEGLRVSGLYVPKQLRPASVG